MAADRSSPPPSASALASVFPAVFSATSTPPPRVRVLLDPRVRTRGGSALDRVNEVEAALRRFELPSEIVLLRSRGHAEELARAARADGVDILAIAAGDAVLNEVVQTYISPDGEAIAGPDLAVLPLGRGDFRRTLGLSGALEEAVARLRHGRRRAIDLGVMTYRTSGSGEGNANAGEMRRAFLNVASFGLEGEAERIREAAHLPDQVPPLFGRLLAMGRALGSFRGASVRIHVDGAPLYEGAMLNVAITNGRFFGGGLRIAPQADPSDGRLDVVILGELTRRELLAMGPRIFRGAHLTSDGVRFARGLRIEAEPMHAWARIPLELDGETVGELPVRATLLEKALNFRT